MISGPKYKICKRLGASVFEKCQTQKFQLAETRAPRRTSRGKRGGGGDFGLQLLEKQKARFTYGLSESQFSRYAHEAMEHRGGSATGLLSRLEARLDNVVFRAGLTKTRRAARQLVSHGHVLINGTRIDIPSYKVEVGDTLAVREGSRASALFVAQEAAERRTETKAPRWMEMGEGGLTATVTAEPGVEESEAPFNAPVVIQFYSR